MWNWLKRIARSAQLYSTILYSEEDLKNFISQNYHATIFFGDTDTPEFEVFHSFARKATDSKFAHSPNSDLKALFNITKEFGFIVHNHAEPEEDLKFAVVETDANSTNLNKELQTFLNENTGISLMDFEHNIYHRLARDFEPFVILFVKNYTSEDTLEAREQLKKVAKKIKKHAVSVVLQVGGRDESDRIISEEGVNREDMPVIYIIDRANNRRYKIPGKITSTKIENSVNKWQAGSLKPTLKKSQAPEENEGPIFEVVHGTWNDIVVNNEKDVLVEFYAPGCYQCEQIEPAYAEVADRVRNNKNLVLARLDSTQNEIDGVVISGTPTFKFFKRGRKDDPIPMYGTKSAPSLLESLKNLVSYPWVEDDLDEGFEVKKPVDAKDRKCAAEEREKAKKAEEKAAQKGNKSGENEVREEHQGEKHEKPDEL